MLDSASFGLSRTYLNDEGEGCSSKRAVLTTRKRSSIFETDTDDLDVHEESEQQQRSSEFGRTEDEERPDSDYRSGCRGVSWNRRMKSWLAFWTEHKIRRSKTFNAKVLGFEAARDAAIDFLHHKRAVLQTPTSPPLSAGLTPSPGSAASLGASRLSYPGTTAEQAHSQSQSQSHSHTYIYYSHQPQHHESSPFGIWGLEDF